MANVNLTDYEKNIYDFLITALSQAYPATDVSPESELSDTYIDPLITMFKPFVSAMNYTDLMQDFANANLMNPVDLDDIAWNKYQMVRLQGTKAEGEFIFEFKNVPPSGTITIPANTVVSKKTDVSVKFITTVRNDFTIEDLVVYYDTAEFVYKVPVTMQAEYVGSKYNCIASEANILESQLTDIVQVYNKYSISNGQDIESNIDFATRIKQSHLGKITNSDTGYKYNVREQFSEYVKDVYVAGFRNPLMQRDLDGDVHRGGKVDIYVQGENLADQIDSLIVPSSGKLYFTKMPIVKVNRVYNETTVEELDAVDYEIFYDELSLKGSINEESGVEITNAEKFSEGDTIRIEYTYNSLIEEIQEYYEEERDVACDVLIRSATPKYVYVKYRVRLVSGYILDAANTEIFYRVTNAYFENLLLNSTIDESSLITLIKQDVDISPMLLTINVPMDALYVSDDKEVEIVADHNSLIELGLTEYPVLYGFEVENIDLE